MHVSVVIPSYQRPHRLLSCLDGVEKQERLPDEVIVVCRSADMDSIATVEQWRTKSRLSVCLLLVDAPGQIAALRKGLTAVRGDVVVFTDDDTVPACDWIQRIMGYYNDPSIGGVGGRDIINGLDVPSQGRRIGVLTWYGKLIGNHHLGCLTAQDVDVLKGANASFRTSLVSFPDFFRGEGAEVHNEVYVCLRVRQMGYRLIYDPEIKVDHYPAPRFDVDQRDSVVPLALRNASFNFTATVMVLLPRSKGLIRLIFGGFVGHKGAPGLLRFLMALLRCEKTVLAEFIPTQIGQMEAIIYSLRTNRGRKQHTRVFSFRN